MADETTNTSGDAAAAPKAVDMKEQLAASRDAQKAEAEAAREPANIAAAKQGSLEGSGAFIEDGAKKAIDVSHPAVDNNPREGTTVRQNQVDFNDPTANDRVAVQQALNG